MQADAICVQTITLLKLYQDAKQQVCPHLFRLMLMFPSHLLHASDTSCAVWIKYVHCRSYPNYHAVLHDRCKQTDAPCLSAWIQVNKQHEHCSLHICRQLLVPAQLSCKGGACESHMLMTDGYDCRRKRHSPGQKSVQKCSPRRSRQSNLLHLQVSCSGCFCRISSCTRRQIHA